MNTKLLFICSKHQCKDNFNKSLFLRKIKTLYYSLVYLFMTFIHYCDWHNVCPFQSGVLY